jgi:hypothetical protein
MNVFSDTVVIKTTHKLTQDIGVINANDTSVCTLACTAVTGFNLEAGLWKDLESFKEAHFDKDLDGMFIFEAITLSEFLRNPLVQPESFTVSIAATNEKLVYVKERNGLCAFKQSNPQDAAVLSEVLKNTSSRVMPHSPTGNAEISAQ